VPDNFRTASQAVAPGLMDTACHAVGGGGASPSLGPLEDFALGRILDIVCNADVVMAMPRNLARDDS
jgi:hypothetical protein